MENWEEALCKGKSELFFPSSDTGKMAEPAKVICAKCPIAGVCLEYALVNKIEHGIWGGKTERERRTIIRRRSRPVKVAS